MMAVQGGFEEYILTGGILLAFVSFIISIILGRKHIVAALRSYGINRSHLLFSVLILLVFISVELYLVKPTQQLFFDDVIYQAGAQQMLNEGQAWMCDYGTPLFCYIGEVFHEPIGTSFNIAIAFAIFGVHEWTAYFASFAASMLSVLLVFIIAFMLFKDFRVAAFSELLMALSPMLLVWAMPTTSDIYTLLYALISVMFLLIFLKRKNIYTLSMLLFSGALVTYMKVDEFLLLIVLLAGYLILDNNKIRESIRSNYDAFGRFISGNLAIIILLVFIVALIPETIYTFNQLTSGNYGSNGAGMQNSCFNTGAKATGNFNVMNFEYNVCSNLLFWIGTYNSQYIMQPFAFTVLMLIGIVAMVFTGYRKELAFLAVWFLAFFILYTAFYAGAVTFGVDWRFMLSVVAQASILGGFGCVAIADIADSILKGAMSRRLYKGTMKIRMPLAYVVIIAIVIYSIFLLVPQLGVNPSNLPQAGDARFYENLVYNQSYNVPSSCLILSYDPTLMNLVNRSSAQMFNFYNATAMVSYQKQYGCIVLDYGYWCYTPNNLCTGIKNMSTLVPIVNATYEPMGKVFGFYYIRNYTG